MPSTAESETRPLARKLSGFWIEYLKHAVLNLGQALQGVRYVYSHPDMDRVAARGTVGHLVRSVGLRARRIVNDLFFASVPPHWHHSDEEVASFHRAPVTRWIQYGYCAWRFGDDGQPKPLTGQEDRRWDPRCL